MCKENLKVWVGAIAAVIACAAFAVVSLVLASLGWDPVWKGLYGAFFVFLTVSIGRNDVERWTITISRGENLVRFESRAPFWGPRRGWSVAFSSVSRVVAHEVPGAFFEVTMLALELDDGRFQDFRSWSGSVRDKKLRRRLAKFLGVESE
jgi:hypothetical protein